MYDYQHTNSFRYTAKRHFDRTQVTNDTLQDKARTFIQLSDGIHKHVLCTFCMQTYANVVHTLACTNNMQLMRLR